MLRLPEKARPWQELPRPEGSSLSLRGSRGITLYPKDRLYQEMAFLGYYLHWSDETLLKLEHGERRRWCREVSEINKKLSGNKDKTFTLQ